MNERSPLRLSQQLGSRCAVCSYPLVKSDQVKQLLCGHIFHADCADQWVEKRYSCRQCGVQVVFPAVTAQAIEMENGESDSNPATGSVYAEAIPVMEIPVHGTSAPRYAACRDCGAVFYRDLATVKPATNGWYRCSSCRRMDIADLVWSSCSLQ